MPSSADPRASKGGTSAIRLARRLGRNLRSNDLRAAGGGLTAGEVQALLIAAGLPPLIENAGARFLAVPEGRRTLYPASQFQGGRPLPGLAETLDALDVDDPWGRLHWLLRDRSMFDMPRLELLQAGEIAKAVTTAKEFGVQKAL